MLMRSPPPTWRRRVPAAFIPPCQPVLADRVPSGDGWLQELKHDGFRIIARKESDHVRLSSRNGRDWSAEFVAITAAVRSDEGECRLKITGENGSEPEIRRSSPRPGVTEITAWKQRIDSK